MNRPMYEALDGMGLPYFRPAKVVGELPTPEERGKALIEATPVIASKLGMKQISNVKFGTPVFCAFDGMTRPKAKHHAESRLLLTRGDDVSLDYCPSYN